MDRFKVSFPQMANYNIPIKYLLNNILNVEFVDSPKITNKTIELGSKYSPDFVCSPFKYTLGTMIETLDMGANILLQAGGGCRYGYYSELQEKILKDLGYKFRLFNLVTNGRSDIKRIYKIFKKIDKKFSIVKSLYYLFIVKKMIKFMDKTDDYIRKNIGFEVNKGDFETLNNEMLESFKDIKGYFDLYFKYRKYYKKIRSVSVNKPSKRLKVGVIGELYTVMEPFSNYEIEKLLAEFKIEVKRFTNVNYLIFENKKETRKALRNGRKYIRYKMEADASNNIYWALYLCKKKYDGIIHIKSSFCTPEIGNMPIIQKICNDYNVPLINFSFDINTSEVGLKTRLEAFYDMIEMRRSK